MGTKRSKAKELKKYVGYSVVAYFKESAIIEEKNGVIVQGKGIAGFLVKVTENYCYFGFEPDVADTIVDIDDVGIIRIPDDVDQILNLSGNNTLASGPESSNGDVQ